MPESKVVDGWALLAWVRDEQPAAGHMRATLQQAEEGNFQLFMSWINAGEGYYMLARKHDAKTAEEIRTTGPHNRMVSFPYPKLMNSNNDVDQAAAVIICSVAKAQSFGVPAVNVGGRQAGPIFLDVTFRLVRPPFFVPGPGWAR